jgi:hypothetical protein
MLSTCGLLGVYYKSTYGLLPLQGQYGTSLRGKTIAGYRINPFLL